jgi:hypothetical protein
MIPSQSVNSDQSVTSSHLVTSHAKCPKIESKHISFEDMHLEALTTRVKVLVDEGLEVIKPHESKQRQVSSHKKYDF